MNSRIGVKICGKPWGVTFDATQDQILVADCGNDQICVFSHGDLDVVNHIGSKGTGKGQFNGPAGIAVQPHSDNIVVCENRVHRVQILTPEGHHLVMFGETYNYRGLFYSPAGVCCNPRGDIIVADYGNHQVQLFDPVGRYLTKFGSVGYTGEHFLYPRDITVLDHHLAPSSITSSVLLVTDWLNHRVCVWSMDGSRFISQINATERARGICVDLGGYVAVNKKLHGFF